MADLFAPEEAGNHLIPWKPEPCGRENWPPPYERIYAWRIKTLHALRSDDTILKDAQAYYKTRPAEFIMHWMDTYNPRKATNKWMPFVLFDRQYEFIQFLEDLRHDSESGLVEKCRDIGATWILCAYSVWCMIFIDEDATGWGSRKDELVDKLGDADSIFEKIRLLIDRLPDVFKPGNIKTAHKKILNEANGSTITGESGDNIGRGGRKSRYVVDEAAHIERPESIEASLGDNTDVRIDISSVNGLGNVFHKRREAGEVWIPGKSIDAGTIRVFIFDWRDHPEKTQEWYDRRKARAEREGMQHIFAQEVDRNYSAAVENTVIAYEWIEAAVDAHLIVPCLRIPPPDTWMAGLDIADEGMDKNALTLRQWIVARHVDHWGERDPGVTARRVVGEMRDRNHFGIQVQYDSIGMGATVRSEYNRLIETGQISTNQLQMIPWNAGAAVINPYERIIPDDEKSMINKQFFHNFKAQAWWSVRTRFYKTWKAVTQGEVYTPNELISISSEIPAPMRHQLMKELAQPTHGKSSQSLKMLINKTPEGTRSPNLADSFVQCYFPAPTQGSEVHIGRYSGG